MIKMIAALTREYPYRTLALMQALVATLGSLYFSEMVGLVPCQLCWWQRIAMYPLVFILAVGLWRREKSLSDYVLPLAGSGLLISLYHNYMYYYANYFLNGANETIMIACSGGVSCTNQQLEWFGFISIPLLALVAFAIIVFAMWMEKKNFKKVK